MEIRFAPYVLRSRGSLNAKVSGCERAGALLRVETHEGVGYADLHPWPELGDSPLEKQLEALASGQLTQLTRRSLYMAELDRHARCLGKSAFSELQVPPSHLLINDLSSVEERTFEEAKSSGFHALKIKLGRNLEAETNELERVAEQLSRFRLRFDFNGTLHLKTCLDWLSSLPRNLSAAIEFLEDPLPWDREQWRELRAKGRVALALDRIEEGALFSEGEEETFDFLVLKPAVQDAEVLAREVKRPLVVTSYMDHPVGQVGAALMAARIYVSEGERLSDCGLLTHTCYEPNKYSEALSVADAKLIPPPGAGIGFDELLEREDWKKLK